MAHIAIHKSPDAYAVLPFFITAGIFFLLFSFLLVFSGGQLFGHHFQPKVLAIVHSLALGWGTMVIYGAAYQLVPVIFERSLRSSKLAFFSYILLTSGTCVLIYSFWYFKIGLLMCVGGLLITLSSYLYFYLLWMTTKDVEHLFELRLYFTFSAFWLCFTTTLGLLLAINLAHGFLTKSHLDILKLHAHVGIVGWFLQLILGAGAKMLPMFLLGQSTKTKWLYVSVILINLGLVLFLLDGYSHPVGLRSLTFGAIVLLGVVCWAVFVVDCFVHRARKVLDIPMKHSFISFLSLLFAFLTLPMVVRQESGNWVNLYAVWVFFGWLTGIILGMTYKTLPFMIWNWRYKDLNGIKKIPLPKELYSQRLLSIQYYLYLVALVVMAVAVAGRFRWALYCAAWLWAALAAVYVVNVGKVVFHQRKSK
ncbi:MULTISPECIES: hypothetical protein [Sphingobacterium]|uniref:hypothetical protein n=1 Tax=Sphingobacterium TaxID=28453 RepID=UPI00257F32EF|nr:MULTISPECIES: hypothetical protein [Sphingobacterium]